MKKKLLIALIAITAAICGAFGFAACGDKDGGNNGTYYLVDIDGSVKKNTYYKLDSGKWNNSDGESGSYETNGNKIIFYSEFMGEKEEWASAVLDNGVLTVTDGLSKDKFISENHKHSYGEWETVSELSCTVDGVKERKCSCGKIDKNVTKCVGYHTGDITVKEATCMEKGLITGYCTVCQKDINEEIDFADHKMGDWQMNEDSHFKACIVCGKIGDVEEHTGSGKCKVCEYPLVATEGLQFTLNDDKNSYTLTGIGNVTDKIIRIPDSYQGLSVTEIGRYAFDGCSLTSITIPDSVTSIDSSAFDECSSLTSITVSANNKNYASQNGILYNKAKTEFVHIPKAITGNIIIPDSVTEIGSFTFYYCSALTSISIPHSVTSIGYGAFGGCSSLISVTIPDSVTSIGDSAFGGCSSLTSINIPDSVTNIGGSAFFGCDKLKTETENGVKYLEKWIIDCDTSVTEVNLRSDTKGIADSAFFKCNSLTKIIIPDGVKSIGNYAFRECTSLTGIIIPDSVMTIGGAVFYDCINLTSVKLSNKITSLSSAIIEYEEGGFFENCCSLINITIPDSVTSIGEGAFIGCSSIKSITIPDSVTSIGGYVGSSRSAFYGCSIETATIPAIACRYIKNAKLKTVIITSGEGIDGGAFENCSLLTSITIPDSITSIGNCAFGGCSALISITIPNSVTSIGGLVFWGCTSLTSVSLPDKVTQIGEGVFNGCSALTSITISDSVTSIGRYAFSGCSSLTSITFKGTKAQWKAIKKSDYWNRDTGNYTIHCTDGDIEK